MQWPFAFWKPGAGAVTVSYAAEEPGRMPRPNPVLWRQTATNGWAQSACQSDLNHEQYTSKLGPARSIRNRRRSLRPSYCARHGARGSNGLPPGRHGTGGNPDMKPGTEGPQSRWQTGPEDEKPHLFATSFRVAPSFRAAPSPYLSSPYGGHHHLRHHSAMTAVSCCISSTFLVSQDRSVPWIAAASPASVQVFRSAFGALMPSLGRFRLPYRPRT